MQTVSMQTVAAPAAAEPWWATAAAAAADVATVPGLGVGAVWVYLQFLRGRAYHARLAIALRPKIIRANGHPGVLVEVGIRKDGSAAVVLPAAEPQNLVVHVADAAQWADAAAGDGVILWREGPVVGRTQDLLSDEGKKISEDVTLEPAEELPSSALIPLPPGDYLAVLVLLTIRARARSSRKVRPWETRHVVIFEGTS
jgi:hypothetical protein